MTAAHLVRPASKARKPQTPNTNQQRFAQGKAPLMTTPDNGPGYTKPKPVARVTVSKDAGRRDCYDGAELRRLPGLTPDRYAAFALPSRVGNRLYYPDGRVGVVG